MSKTYIVRSALPAALIAEMTKPNPLPMPEDEAATEAAQADSGAVLQWEKADASQTGALGLLGIRTVILCIILSLGRSVPDDQLHSLLRRLGLHRDTVLPYASKDGTGEKLTLDKYLELLARKRYLEKVSLHTAVRRYALADPRPRAAAPAASPRSSSGGGARARPSSARRRRERSSRRCKCAWPRPANTLPAIQLTSASSIRPSRTRTTRTARRSAPGRRIGSASGASWSARRADH